MKHKTLDYIVAVALVVAYAMGLGRDTSGEYQCASLLLIGGIAAAISAIGQGIASIIGNRKRKKALRKLNKQYDAMIEDTEDRINANFLDRADSKNAIRKVEESNKEALRQLNTDAIRRGSTDEAKVAMASKLSQRTADVVGELSSIGEQYKDRLRDRKQSLQENKAAQNFQIDSDTSGIDAFSSAISNVGNTAMSMAGAMGNIPSAELGSPKAYNAAKNDIGGVKTAMNDISRKAFENQVFSKKKQNNYGY